MNILLENIINKIIDIKYIINEPNERSLNGEKVWRDPYLRMHIFSFNRPLAKRFDAQIGLRLNYLEFFQYTSNVSWPCVYKESLKYKEFFRDGWEDLVNAHSSEKHDSSCFIWANKMALNLRYTRILRWLFNNNKGCSSLSESYLSESSSQEFSFEMYEEIVSIYGTKATRNDIIYAIKYQSLDVIKYIYARRGIKKRGPLLDYASARGDLEILVWLHENTRYTATRKAVNVAAIMYNLPVVQWLLANRKEGCSIWILDKLRGDSGCLPLLRGIVKDYKSFSRKAARF